MGKFARDKGARGERELVRILNDNGFRCHRGYVFYNEPDVVGLKGVHVEVKNVEKLNLRKAMKQSIDDADYQKDGMPMVFWKKKRDPQEVGSYSGWTVTMTLSDFMRIYGAWIDD